MPGGRPSKYKPEYCEQIIEHMTNGASFVSFAASINVHIDTIKEWESVHPEFSAAKKVAASKSQHWWEQVLMNHATGNEAVKGGNATAAIFALKCRFAYRDQEQQVPDINLKLSYSLDDDTESE